ncbi:MAG: glucans biosynthesis glucosyltransferase MdoH [Azospirillaceae bacterium]
MADAASAARPDTPVSPGERDGPADPGEPAVLPAPSGAGLLRRRRRVFAGLVLGSVVALSVGMAGVLRPGGWTVIEIAMIALFAANTPWIVIGFWNAVIGLVLLARRRDALAAILPGVARPDPATPIRGRTAIVMPIHNEDPARALRHARATLDSLDRASPHDGDRFTFFLLSDTTDPAIAAEEEAAARAWAASPDARGRVHYRRRAENTGLKAGNLRDFCVEEGRGFATMVVLDADSVMTGRAIRRLVATLEANPRLAILQALVVGMPTTSPFARLSQFGMRHGMRPYATGAAWWQGPAGPYWGHNAAIRLAPFRRHCDLPELGPGRRLGGRILSHDQVEAVMLQRAGWETRVLPVEDGSYEENPPTLPDHLKRDLRWCHGNMQYLKLLRLPGLTAMGWLQLALAIAMYLASPLWLGFLVLAFAQVLSGGFAGGAAGGGIALWGAASLGIGLFATMIGVSLTPPLCGLADVLLRPSARRTYGGAGRLIAGGGLAIGFSMLLAPVLALAHCLFLARLALARHGGARWEAQRRDGHVVGLAAAFAGLWPQTLAGLAGTAILALAAPSILPWAAPVLAGLTLAAPLTWATSLPAVGRALARAGLAAPPEEIRDVPEILAAQAGPATAPRAATTGGSARPAGEPRPAFEEAG